MIRLLLALLPVAAFAADPADFFLKPFDDEKLVRAIHCHLDT